MYVLTLSQQILVTNLQGNVQQLGGGLGVKGLMLINFFFSAEMCSHLLYLVLLHL